MEMLRTATEQPSHDQIIQRTVLVYLMQGFDVVSNPGQGKNFTLDGRYPDVLAFDKGSHALEILAEVETDSTVEQGHAQEQWVPFAASVYIRGAQFKLLDRKSVV